MEKGCFHIYTGDGKGKTTAALGLALRAAGAGMQVYIGQFMKKGDSSEYQSIAQVKGITIEGFGSGCFIRGEPSAEDRALAARGWERVCSVIRSGEHGFVVLDEVFPAIVKGLLDEKTVLAMILDRPEAMELAATGRGASAAAMDAADLVTVMTCIKHYYAAGRAARKGIES